MDYVLLMYLFGYEMNLIFLNRNSLPNDQQQGMMR